MNGHIQKTLILRFADMQQDSTVGPQWPTKCDQQLQQGWLKFIRTAEQRKRQIIEKMLLEPKS